MTRPEHTGGYPGSGDRRDAAAPPSTPSASAGQTRPKSGAMVPLDLRTLTPPPLSPAELERVLDSLCGGTGRARELATYLDRGGSYGPYQGGHKAACHVSGYPHPFGPGCR